MSIHTHTYIVHVHAELATLELPVDKLSQNPGENTDNAHLKMQSCTMNQIVMNQIVIVPNYCLGPK